MSELSPAAQAVTDAYANAIKANPHGRWCENAIAAALRAAVDQVVSSVPPPCADFDEYAQGFLAAHTKYHCELLAIAAELENHQ